MINKITKLKDFGIFHDFTWKTELLGFKQFNLIYGSNRSGKTTISRVFSACERKSISFRQYPKAGEFEVKPDNGSNIRSGEIANCNLPIKVFNKDFIDDNISFIPSDSCNPIIYVSEEDIESKKKLETLKQNKIDLDKNLETAQKTKKVKEEARNNFLTGLGREIANVLFDKTYNKTKVENKIKTIGIDNFGVKVVSDDDKTKIQETSRSQAKRKQQTFLEYKIAFVFSEENIGSFDDVFLIIHQLLEKKVVSQTLERLRNDKEVNKWVKQGYDLHKTKDEKEKCLFCQKMLDPDFFASLSKHFTKDYEDLQSNIAAFIPELQKLRKDDIPSKNNDLYPDLQINYQKQAKHLNNVVEALNRWIDAIIEKLKEKLESPLSAIDSPAKPEAFETSYNDIIKELNKIIKEHNDKVDNHGEEVKTARAKLELHLIAKAIEEQHYKTIEEDYEEAKEEEKTARKATKRNQDEIQMLEQQTSTIGKGLQKLNKHLEGFFGGKEVQLELDSSKKGYLINRDGRFADNLSEGEKTAIAFSYFIVKAQERDFKIKDGIFFVDDPVSSFDSNSIYYCFSLLQNHFKGAAQLFVATHNFQLFNLIKGWFLRKNRKKEVCAFHMIENYVESAKRKARIQLLEETLRKFKSEYHFLFDRLNKFVQNPSPEYADFYTIGNIARRFLEIFTDFKIPTTGDLASKIEALEIDTKQVSEAERYKVYKLIQEFSHGSDPTGGIEHKDKSESQEAIKILLRIVKGSDLKHFELLERNL